MKRVRGVALCLAAGAAAAVFGAQFQRFGEWEVHYIAFNATQLSAQIAERYDIVRGPNKGLVNVSAVRPAPGDEERAEAGAEDGGEAGTRTGRGEKAQVEGRFVDLLGRARVLRFREIDDAGTFYYLAAFEFPHGEMLRFEITVTLPGRGAETVRFEQPLYRSDR